MKNQFLIGSFKSNDEERKYVIAAVPEKCYGLAYDTNEFDEEVPGEIYNYTVKFGIAVCRERDTFNEELGKKIAMGKALCERTRVGFINMTHGMFLTTQYLDMCLKRLAELLEAHPEQFIAAYYKSHE